ncbi:MAG: transporter [Epsilonproteobacteria bacterium]|nr:transporter [Campylobacterota bacterium]
MSSFIATVTQIDSCDSLHIVKFRCSGIDLTMMSLELSSEIEVSTVVKLAVKPTHISITKSFDIDTTHENLLKTKVEMLDNGSLLSSVELRFGDTLLESIITLESSKRLKLQQGDEVLALIQASELSIVEILK